MATNGISVDTTPLDILTRDLLESKTLVKLEVDKAVLEVGSTIAATAKEIAGKYSKSIPPTIHLVPAPGVAIVRAGSEDVPLAALYEKGNAGKGGGRIRTHITTSRGNDATRSAFRHPVFGDMTDWVEQQRHPFLRPALTRNRPVIKNRMIDAYDRALYPITGNHGGGGGDDGDGGGDFL